MHDLGTMTIDGKTYNIVNAEKVGRSVLHILDEELPLEKEAYINKSVVCTIDKERRSQLRAHHSGTHVVFASC